MAMESERFNGSEDDWEPEEIESWDGSDEVEFFREHEELYGLLLMVDQKLENAGDGLVAVFIPGTLGLCVAIHLEWFPDFLGLPVAKFQSFWFFLLLGILALTIIGAGTNSQKQMIYRRFRPEILDYLATHQISGYQLIARIEGQAALSDVAEILKADATLRHGFPRSLPGSR